MGTFKAEAMVVDFLHAPEEARGQINTWAAQKTKNLINSVLPPGSIDPATTRVMVGNAVYFKGAWEGKPFDRRLTVHKPFHRLDGSHVDVPFMQSRMRQFVAIHDGFKVLKLRYRMAAHGHTNKTPTPAPFGRVELEQRTIRYVAPPQRAAVPTQFSMCIFLPEAHNGLRGLLDTIASRPGFLHEHLPHQRIDVHEIRVPKFKLSFYSSVVAVLKLGLRLPFCGKADLSDMVEDDSCGLPIVVDDIIHKAVIEVNEEASGSKEAN
ncbi:hypothetical protein QYE76_064265 [Lolium multiflorum]|uniref:Serpin domain-containing protein n=1 Tax=Lolium multiflorum TaxID=4521 RepID=A0AAD8W8Z1_LOLMU|nr:hypothetical protein QYE76_064265 [Lolium multiflorum]